MTGPQLRELMRAAQRQGLLVPAFNVAYLGMVEPICEQLAATDSFGLLEVSRPDLERFGARSLAAVAEQYRRWADPDRCALHLDHVPVVDERGERVDWEAMMREGLEAGYHSVMIDASRTPLEENLALTRRVVEMARPYGAPVEAELGAVLGHEAGPLPPYEELFATGRGFTAVEEARRFVAETGVDWLSVAVGNVHGALEGAAAKQPKLQARLAVDRVAELAQATGVPLVLHGGSGIPAHYLHAAARAGVVKINIGTEIRQAWERTLAEGGSESQAQAAVGEAVRAMLEQRLQAAGGAARLAAAVG